MKKLALGLELALATGLGYDKGMRWRNQLAGLLRILLTALAITIPP